MTLNIGRELSDLRRMTVDQLRARYLEVFGEPTNARHKEWLIKRIAWRTQANSEGGLTERALKRAAELACESDLRLSPPKLRIADEKASTHKVSVAQRRRTDQRLPVAGTVITRPYKGSTVQVKVLADGFEYEGEVLGSLSAVATKITGSHCNGYHFFRLGQGSGT